MGSGATTRPHRETLIEAARPARDRLRPAWRLDRWGRSLVDLVNTLQELNALDVGFVSLCDALDLTTPSGRALAGMLAVFAEFERDILRDRVKAGIEQARKDKKPHGRPMTAGKLVPEMKQLRKEGLTAISHRWDLKRRLESPTRRGNTADGSLRGQERGD